MLMHENDTEIMKYLVALAKTKLRTVLCGHCERKMSMIWEGGRRNTGDIKYVFELLYCFSTGLDIYVNFILSWEFNPGFISWSAIFRLNLKDDVKKEDVYLYSGIKRDNKEWDCLPNNTSTNRSGQIWKRYSWSRATPNTNVFTWR